MLNSFSSTLNNFLKQFKPILYRRKERIILPGEELNIVCYITQGHVIQNIISPNGNEFTSYIFSPKAFFPLIWQNDKLLDGHYYEYKSLMPVEVYKIPKKKLADFLAENPSAFSILTEQLTVYSAELLKKLETRIFDKAVQVVIVVLLDLIKIFGKKYDKQMIIDYWFTHQDIANIAGLSREAVSRGMNSLVKKKLISYKNHFIAINDREALEAVLQSEN